uniref:Uncharacterized protein n=1 Tax=Phlegmariurus squarrosus TaxID=73615 RepID=H9M898_PHLSQ|nr:hypothetical protein HusqMp127 [Phlegmariurus squarrosus]AEV55805.1 hypothetical protein HusqMp127 [Phlegmariurus squarrosus]
MGKQFDNIYHSALAELPQKDIVLYTRLLDLYWELVQQATPEIMGKPTSQPLKCPKVEYFIPCSRISTCNRSTHCVNNSKPKKTPQVHSAKGTLRTCEQLSRNITRISLHCVPTCPRDKQHCLEEPKGL